MSTAIPSFEERCRNNQHPIPSNATSRLLWYIRGPSLKDNVFVLSDSSDPAGPSQLYALEATDSKPRWHDISREPVTTPAVSSVTVQSRELQGHPDWWASETHRHADPDFDFCVYGEEHGNGTRKLLQCCGEDRPQEHVPLLIKASTRPFVTIHDYISAVHPWIFSLREGILAASLNPPDDGSKLVINYNDISSVKISSEERWTLMTRDFCAENPPYNPPDNPPSIWHTMFTG